MISRTDPVILECHIAKKLADFTDGAGCYSCPATMLWL